MAAEVAGGAGLGQLPPRGLADGVPRESRQASQRPRLYLGSSPRLFQVEALQAKADGDVARGVRNDQHVGGEAGVRENSCDPCRPRAHLLLRLKGLWAAHGLPLGVDLRKVLQQVDQRGRLVGVLPAHELRGLPLRDPVLHCEFFFRLFGVLGKVFEGITLRVSPRVPLSLSLFLSRAALSAHRSPCRGRDPGTRWKRCGALA